ncbi:MAG: septum formation initiator family protein [Ignavibacteriae bacterium]|nr:septum formation initiator family protein [Ignavibacteriota bacterium]MCB9242550.1 septum formation initiator family protein [Ignavibacteriales bacterium]
MRRKQSLAEEKQKVKISVFYALLSLTLIAILIVFYINNIIASNNLSVETNKLKGEINDVKQTNDFLMTEVEKLSSFERIKQVAEERLNMVYSDSVIDEGKVIILKKSDLESN